LTQDSPDRVLSSYRLGDGSARPDTFKVADTRLITFLLTPHSSKLQFGGELILTAVFEVIDECKIGGVFVHFWRNGDFVATSDITLSREEALVLHPGKSELRISLFPVHLQAGRYTLSFSAFDETRKRTIIHWLHFSELDIEGPAGAGTPYVVPMSIALSANASQSNNSEQPVSVGLNFS
jgi:hypothetical protein